MYYKNRRLKLITDPIHLNPLYKLEEINNEGPDNILYSGNDFDELYSILDAYTAKEMKMQFESNRMLFKDISKILESANKEGK